MASQENEDGAVGWFIALNEAPDDLVLRRRFEAWLAESPANRQAWEETQRAWAALGPGPERPQRFRRVAAATGVAMMLVLAALFGPGAVTTLRADHVTATALDQSWRLADGSVAHLAPRSALAVSEDGASRTAVLLRGEAFFDVTHDGRPFQVKAGDGVVTVLGTAFNVRRLEDGLEVGVRNGRVRVETAAGETVLGPGDRLVVEADGAPIRQRVQAQDVGAWTTGDLVARARPVAEVVDELRPWFAGVILAPDEELGRQTVTGVYDLRDPVGALQALANARGGEVRRITPWILVLSRKPV